MFTPENTYGYTTAELVELNAELAAILSEILEENVEARWGAEQAFADAVAGR